jgi:hypothetical protein
MEVHRLGVKFFAEDAADIRLEDFIPIFHGWIQKQNVIDHLLIDVHNYSHMYEGPGILLVAHEGNFSIDMGDGRLGLMHYRKTPTPLSPVRHLMTILRAALQVCRQLEQDAGLRFNMDEFVIISNDRLNAPNEEQSFVELRPVLTHALEQMFEGGEFDLARTSLDPKERLTVTCKRL